MSSRRPDGTSRPEIRTRPGYIPSGETKPYVPPAARNLNNITPNSDDGSNEEIDDWVKEDAPVLKLINYSSNKSKAEETETEESEAEAEEDNEEVDKPEEAQKLVRQPSQLATAIDDALDSLSLGGSPGLSGAERPMGRFAMQIAREAQQGDQDRSSHRRNENCSRNNWNRNGGDSRQRNSSHQRSGSDHQRDYRNNHRNDARGSNNYSNSDSQRDQWINSSVESGAQFSLPKPFSDDQMKAFLSELNILRREMALINAKLEYIRYIKAREGKELSEIERKRLELETSLLRRLDEIFEKIEALGDDAVCVNRG